MQNEKQIILRYAEKKFFSEGFHKISMDAIASELKISKKTIYKFFFSKEKLIEDIVQTFLDKKNNEINEILEKKIDGVEKFMQLIECHGKSSPEINEKFLKELQLYLPKIWEKIDSFSTEKINTVLFKLIKFVKKDKLIKDYPPELITVMIIAIVKSVKEPSFLINNKLSLKQALHYAFDIQFNGLLTDEGKLKYYKNKKQINKKEKFLK